MAQKQAPPGNPNDIGWTLGTAHPRPGWPNPKAVISTPAPEPEPESEPEPEPEPEPEEL
jgi:hypothetical protein